MTTCAPSRLGSPAGLPSRPPHVHLRSLAPLAVLGQTRVLQCRRRAPGHFGLPSWPPLALSCA
eukprot:8235773-Pyramimonas_sp.AAC.1